jgi:hypothetical protein
MFDLVSAAMPATTARVVSGMLDATIGQKCAVPKITCPKLKRHRASSKAASSASGVFPCPC